MWCRRYSVLMTALGAAVLWTGAGCSKGTQFTEQELEQMKKIKEGQRTEMPAEGKKLMEDIAAGRVKPGPPPPSVGQPGPGGVVQPPVPSPPPR